MSDCSLLIRDQVDSLYRTESRKVFATLVRLLGDFDAAEEATQEAFAAALTGWSDGGVPANPVSWLVSTGRFKAIDLCRRRGRLDHAAADLGRRLESLADRNEERRQLAIEDDRLRLMFTCCHPAIDPDVQIALTLREVCGLKTEEIASAFLVPTPTLAQRIVRGKSKIVKAGIRFEMPSEADLPERLAAVLLVIYLVYREGYSASSGTSVTRADLSAEAIRLGRLVVDLLPDPEALGLLALMVLQESRRAARMTEDGDLVLLEEQDRGLWDRELISQGVWLIDQALVSQSAGPYTLQAAIAAVHATAPSSRETNWSRIVSLYNSLLAIHPSPVVELNRAVAVAMRDGPAIGLEVIDGLLAQGDLSNYHLAHAARADLLRRLNRISESRSAYEKALELARQDPERRFLLNRIAELTGGEPVLE